MINLISSSLGAGVGFVAGGFSPAIGRRIKALFVKDSTALKASAEAEAKKLAAKV